ncbi:hypothetical protein BLS_007182 [Venturia inaequalis]|uniref:Uncharacterized protein n=1 Tax=Venturia inaequalis TaxID=5025 RepID=A0A8H3U9Y6_VENIN|nr:hypothetical protein BLS_007182 [Venturia inaequalis]
MDALQRDHDKQCEDTGRLEDRLQKEKDTKQMKGLMKSANTFKAGYHDKQNLNLFPTREEIQAEAKLLKEKAAEKASGGVDAKTPQLNQSSKRRADIAGTSPVSETTPAIENTSVKRLKFTGSNPSFQTSSPLSNPTTQKSLQAKNPQQPSTTAAKRDKNKTVFLPTSQSRLDSLQDMVDDVVSTNRSTVWTKICQALEIKTELGDSAYQKYLQAVLSKSSSAVRVSMQCSEPDKWIFDNAGQQFKHDIPWKDIKPYIKSLKVFVEQGYPSFSNKKVKNWLKDHVKDAPKLSRVEIFIRYREGSIDTKKEDKNGADMDWQYGKKDSTMRFACDLWSFSQLKRVSFTIQKKYISGDICTWCCTERDQDKKIWKDWTSGRWAW